MHPSYPPSPMPSHSNEVERRLTQTETAIESHAGRITVLERMLMGVIYALGALTAGKTGDLAELVLSALKAKS